MIGSGALLPAQLGQGPCRHPGDVSPYPVPWRMLISHSSWGGMSLAGLSHPRMLPLCSPACTLSLGWEHPTELPVTTALWPCSPHGHPGGTSPLSSIILVSPEDN